MCLERERRRTQVEERRRPCEQLGLLSVLVWLPYGDTPLDAPRLAGMAHLYRDLSVKSLYTDRKFEGGTGEWKRKIESSTTLYIGNLSFYSTEEQLYEFFGACGEVKRIVMGLDRHTKTPCGFCFVEYFQRNDTEDAVRYLSGCKLDDRIVRVDWDGGFEEGRQYGRGRSGGQVREEYRTDFDAQRGGWGRANESPAPMPQPRRRSFDGPYRGPGGAGGGAGCDAATGGAPSRRRAIVQAQQGGGEPSLQGRERGRGGRLMARAVLAADRWPAGHRDRTGGKGGEAGRQGEGSITLLQVACVVVGGWGVWIHRIRSGAYTSVVRGGYFLHVIPAPPSL